MKETNRRAQGNTSYGQQLAFTIGVVKNNADPAHHGRLQVFIPSIDSEDFDVKNLPWAIYVSSFGGVTANPVVGREGLTVPGLASYGTWAIPKNGAQVLIGFLDGNPEMRFWLGCLFMPEYNRTMPGFVNGLETELDDSGLYPPQEVPALKDNLTDAGLYKSDKHFKTRGGYERSISHPSNKNSNKPTDNGYAPNPLEPSKADSQTYVPMRTPGGHFIAMSDVDEYCRVRFKTIAGSQILLDDTNERIYISSAKGRNWIELDETNGRVYIYSDSKVSIRAKNDINLYSDENINIVANKRLNLVSEERSVVIQAKMDVSVLSQEANVKISASRDLSLNTFNGPSAAAVSADELAQVPSWHQAAPVGKGYIYRWAESGGSSTSSIKLDSAQTVESYSADATAITSMQNLDIKAASALNSSAGSTYSISGSSVNLQGSTISHTASSCLWTVGSMGLHEIDPSGVVIADGGASPANSARDAVNVESVDVVNVVEHMILPDHESWTRDEDEGRSATPRGPKYQG